MPRTITASRPTRVRAIAGATCSVTTPILPAVPRSVITTPLGRRQVPSAGSDTCRSGPLMPCGHLDPAALRHARVGGVAGVPYAAERWNLALISRRTPQLADSGLTGGS